jgi:stage IV sporulation protein FB
VFRINLEPPRTAYDLHFRISGIPIRIHPFFWLGTIICGVGADTKPIHLLLWVVAVLVSVVVHELGHAFAIRHFGFRPWIVLHGFGGLALHDPSESLGYDPEVVLGRENLWRIKSSRSEIIISLAGPVAGFLFAFLIVALVWVTAGPVGFRFDKAYFFDFDLPYEIVSINARVFLRYMLFINICWGLINLLPIFPLDGGQVARELLINRYGNQGWIRLGKLGMITCAVMAVIVLLFWCPDAKLFGLFMFGSLGYNNFMIYKQASGFGGYGRKREPWENDDRGW